MHSRVYHGLCMNLENSAADHQQDRGPLGTFFTNGGSEVLWQLRCFASALFWLPERTMTKHHPNAQDQHSSCSSSEFQF